MRSNSRLNSHEEYRNNMPWNIWALKFLLLVACTGIFFALRHRFLGNSKQPQEKNHLSTRSRLYQVFRAYQYLFAGSTMIEQAYKKSQGNPFIIQTPERKTIMVSSKQHIRELDKAPRNKLSLHAVAKELLQPMYTMKGFEWENQRGLEGTGYVRALRERLTLNLPDLLQKLSRVISAQLGIEIGKSVFKDGWHRLPLFEAAKEIAARANCAVFFPTEISNSPEFVKAAIRFPEDVFIAAQVIRLFPRSIAPSIAKLITRNHQSARQIHEYLSKLILERMLDEDPYAWKRYNDGVQWIIDSSPRKGRSFEWSVERMVGEIMGIWYASLHTLAITITYSLVDLYSRPEYVTPLREEASGPLYKQFECTGEGLPEMDSFLKESVRLRPFESTPICREALQDFTFSDGFQVPKGSWVCIPYRSMVRDNRNFPNATKFDGRRFLKKDTGDPKCEGNSGWLADSSESWLVWGPGRINCPGRFYASAALKLVVALLVRNYDCELEPFDGEPYTEWRTSLIPKSGLTLRVKQRC